MPQIQLPIFPAGINKINGNVGFARDGETIVYFYGHLPIFRHQVDDSASFRLITSQLHVDGSIKQVDIYRAFGVTPLSLKRSVKVYREKGAAGFFEKPRRRGPAVLTKPVLETIQGLLDEDYKIPEIARKLDLLADTIRKAVKAGKLHKPQNKNDSPPLAAPNLPACSKSERSLADSQSPIGMGATDIAGRMATSIFGCEALPPSFTSCLDIPKGGVLFAIPALLASGLLNHADKYFQLPSGYYRLDSLFLLLALTALSRVKSIDLLRLLPPGAAGPVAV